MKYLIIALLLFASPIFAQEPQFVITDDTPSSSITFTEEGKIYFDSAYIGTIKGAKNKELVRSLMFKVKELQEERDAQILKAIKEGLSEITQKHEEDLDKIIKAFN